ncbi:hypothetical protein HBI56_129370 [Parastagonospora nodorum]|nr:hypothetical protein HBI56_129370 [Parastagonospora nodorum]
MRDRWGPERGSMVALEADENETRVLIAFVYQQDSTTPELEIASFNGPKSHVIVGSAAAVESLGAILWRSRIEYTMLNTDLGQATWIEAGSNSSITDCEDEFWTRPNVPDHTDAYAEDKFDLLDGVYPAPITVYNVPSKLVAMAGWIAPKDARSRIVLHMNWYDQTLPILFRGLPSAKHAGRTKDATWQNMVQPSNEEILQGSPYAQIVRGNYKSPTHIVFGTNDNLIPWQQAKWTTDIPG